MTPTLRGRIETRIIVVLAVGIVWTILLSPILTVISFGPSFVEILGFGFLAVLLTAFFGAVIWEPLYHGLQQFRWEKDWPTGLGLVTGLNEGLLVLIFLALIGSISIFSFFVHFTTTWLLIWFFLNGPLRVLAPEWRFRGGRFF